MAQRYEYQDIDGHVILLFVHPALSEKLEHIYDEEKFCPLEDNMSVINSV